MKNILDPFYVLGIAENAIEQERDEAYQRLKARLEAAQDLGDKGAGFQLDQVEAAYQVLANKKRINGYLKNYPRPETPPFTLRMLASRHTIESLPETQVVYFLLDVIPARREAVEEKAQAPLNLTLVLDQSNSMKGTRLERVKVAASEIIDQLGERDYLSVVGFNDRATVLIDATPVENKKVLASRARMARASGGTEILQGLRAGLNENRKYLSDDYINHVILLTDGKTYGDEEACLLLANTAAREGISVSTLGLGSDWNDAFLDQLAALTGGASGFIKSANSVVEFMNSQVEKLSKTYSDRMQLSIVLDVAGNIERVFKLQPSAQPLSHTSEVIQLGGIPNERKMRLLVQVQLPADIPVGVQDVARLVVTGDVVGQQARHVAVSEVALEVASEAEYSDPPEEILDALAKLTLYNMQESATEALERGDYVEATARLQNLATRLLDMGHEDLAKQTVSELNQVKQTRQLTDQGRKTIKYETRYLIAPDSGSLE